MVEAVQLKSRTKFTPERIQQISNLVERGKSRDEIASIVGVTTGTLQVTCSKMGISLRRPRIIDGICLLRQRTPPSTEEQSQGSSGSELRGAALVAKPQQGRMNTPEARAVNVAIRFQYGGRARTDELPLTLHTMAQLALEAALRDMELGELIAEIITAMVNNDLFPPVLDNSDRATDRTAADELSKATTQGTITTLNSGDAGP